MPAKQVLTPKAGGNAVEYILYTLAGIVFAAVSYSFLLWLRY